LVKRQDPRASTKPSQSDLLAGSEGETVETRDAEAVTRGVERDPTGDEAEDHLEVVNGDPRVTGESEGPAPVAVLAG